MPKTGAGGSGGWGALTSVEANRHAGCTHPDLLLPVGFRLLPFHAHAPRWLEVRAKPNQPGFLQMARHLEAHQHAGIVVLEDLDVD